MKVTVYPTLIAVIAFLVLTALTYHNEAASDGYIQARFPFLFFKNTSGKLIDPAYRSQLGFQTLHFMLDVVVLLLFIVLANVSYQKLIGKSTSKPSA